MIIQLDMKEVRRDITPHNTIITNVPFDVYAAAETIPNRPDKPISLKDWLWGKHIIDQRSYHMKYPFILQVYPWMTSRHADAAARFCEGFDLSPETATALYVLRHNYAYVHLK